VNTKFNPKLFQTMHHLETTISAVSVHDAEQVTVAAEPVVSHAEAEASRHRDESADLGYIREKRFLGTLFGIIFVVLSVASSYNVPTGILTAINNDLGTVRRGSCRGVGLTLQGPSKDYINITILWTITSATALIVMGRCSDLFGKLGTARSEIEILLMMN
jgi:hypothetical protein